MKDTTETKKTHGKIAVIGGDLRQLEAAKAFAQKGYECHVYGLDIVGESHNFDSIIKAENLSEALVSATLVLLPLPYSRDGIHINAPLSTQKIKITALFPLLSPRQKIAAGLLGATLPEGFEAFDYAASESFAIRNARATVEGALAIAIRETTVTLNDAHILVVGYGRIGKMLASTLKDLGAKVTVIARRASDRAWALAQGLGSENYDSLLPLAANCDIVFNTVPAIVITGEILSALNKDAVIIELASPPGGIDLHEAAQNGTHVISALGLPGKFSPKTAGHIITDCVSDAFGL